MDERRGIGSVDTAMTILKVFADARGPLTLTEVGQRSGMSTSKLHRYLASLVAQGMLSQRERSGRYDLGPFALRLGVGALARNDFVNRTAAALPDLVEATGLTAMLSVWGNGGATVIRWERGRDHVVTSLGLGTVLPLIGSATGRIFLAFLPSKMTAPHVPAGSRRMAETYRKDVAAAGYATVGGDLIPGLYALAAPVLNWQGEAEAAVTLISTAPALTAPDGIALARLRETCRSVSVGAVDTP